MFIDTKVRSSADEIMDDLQMEGELLRRSLHKLDWINKWLGGNQVTISGLKTLLKGIPKNKVIKIVDLGCGSGDMLRIITRYMRQENRLVEIIGIDANEFTINYAREQSKYYPEIRFLPALVTPEILKDLDFDILLSTLFLHHLDNEEISALLKEASRKATVGILINDLHRSRWAYVLFYLLTLFIPNPMIRQDGLTSILRGFKKADLKKFNQELTMNSASIKWRWAFRYQWIIKTS